MWKIKTKIAPVIAGALGMIKSEHKDMLMKLQEICLSLKFKK